MTVFLIATFATAILLIYLSIHHWIRNHRLTSKAIQTRLKTVSKLLTLEQWSEAQNALLPLLHHAKGGAKAHLYYARALHGANALDQALHAITHASKLYPEELLLRLEEGKILLDLERPDEALKTFKVCGPILHTESDTITLALALLRGGFPEQCWHHLEQRVDKSKNSELIALAAETLYILKRYPESIQFFEYAIELGNRKHRILTYLAHAYRKLGNLAKAEQIYRDLLEKDPGDVEAILGLGHCMEERGEIQKAFFLYQSTHAWKKKDCRLIKHAAIAALHIRKYAYAERYFYEVMRRGEQSPTLLSYYGYSLERQKKWPQAEQVYLNLIKAFPAKANGYRGVAWLFGVGLTTTVSEEQGVNFAHISLKLVGDVTSWEILSAVFARIGNFERAYQIQEGLLAKESDKAIRQRRQEALRCLRKNHPLNDHHLGCSLVA